MKKHIGIVMPLSINGGVFQLAISITEALLNCSKEFSFSIIHYHNECPKPFLNVKRQDIKFISVLPKKLSLAKKIFHFIGLAFLTDFLLLKDYYHIFKKQNIDLLIYPTPFTFDFFPYKTDFIASIPNLMHRYYPKFPEFGFLENIKRNIIYKWYAKNSILNTVDAEQGADDILKFLGIKKEKSKVNPYIPAGYIYKYKNMDSGTIEKTLFKYSLPDNFLFYPAQFWYHKNHIRLIEAINIVKEKYNLKVNVAFTGVKKGNYEKTFELLKKYNIQDQIFHLGYVSEKEIVALYKKSLALVFPSLFGPTDIPCLEAMVLGTPIACSNLFEIPNQVRDGGIYFNPFDEKDMAEKIYKIWTDEKLRKKLVQNGTKIARNITQENYAKAWEKIIKEVLERDLN